MALSDLPLAGSVVIDLSDECLCLGGRWLSDFGADVIRVEAASGDGLRIGGPHLNDRSDAESGLRHLLYNAGKRSLALNFDAPGAWDLVDRLLAAADVVLAPLDKSVEARRFFERERLERVHPHLGVIDVVTRRGGEGLPASDIVGVAAGGLMQGLGFPEVAPDYPAGKLAYKQASQVAAGDGRGDALRPAQRGSRESCLHLAAGGDPVDHDPLRQREPVASAGREGVSSGRGHPLAGAGEGRQVADVRDHAEYAPTLGGVRSVAVRALGLGRHHRRGVSGRHLHPGVGRRDASGVRAGLRHAGSGGVVLRGAVARVPGGAGQLRAGHRGGCASARAGRVFVGGASAVRAGD